MVVAGVGPLLRARDTPLTGGLTWRNLGVASSPTLRTRSRRVRILRQRTRAATSHNLGESSDGALVASVRMGEPDAYRELFQRHRGRVSKIVGAYVADRETRLDLVQDVFVRAIERLHQLQEPERFAPWLSQIARRVSIDFLRSQKTSVSPTDQFAELATTDPSPSDVASASELSRSVGMCFAVLSPRDATVLTLVVQLGFTSSDLSEALGVTQNNAKVILHRARRRLRTAVEIAESSTAETAV